MPIYKGNTKIVKLYKGTTQIVKRYKGTNIIYSASRLPSAFQEVEYLESSGTQYIDSGQVINENTRVVAKLYVTQNADNCFFGTRDASRENTFCLLKLNSSPFNFRTDYGRGQIQQFSGNLDTWYEIDKNKNITYLDGTTVSTFSVETINNPYSMTIFARKTGSDVGAFAYCRISYCQIYDNNTLVRDFIPCYRKADNVAGLYDLVNGVFYTNAGTGTFIVGGNV